MLEEQLAKALLRARGEAGFGLALHGAHVTSRGEPFSRRWIAWRSSSVKRRCRPGVRNAGWMSPGLTARIRGDLLIPSHRAAALVESAGFIGIQPEQTRQAGQTCGGGLKDAR